MSRPAWTALGLAAIVTVLGALLLMFGASKKPPAMAPQAENVSASQLEMKGWGFDPNAKKPVANPESSRTRNYEIQGRMTD